VAIATATAIATDRPRGPGRREATSPTRASSRSNASGSRVASSRSGRCRGAPHEGQARVRARPCQSQRKQTVSFIPARSSGGAKANTEHRIGRSRCVDRRRPPGSIASASSSPSGTRTNPRSCILGCGITRSGSSTVARRTRGCRRRSSGPPAFGAHATEGVLHAEGNSSSSRGVSVVSTWMTAFRYAGCGGPRVRSRRRGRAHHVDPFRRLELPEPRAEVLEAVAEVRPEREVRGRRHVTARRSRPLRRPEPRSSARRRACARSR
jgi:hypothetical protein